MALIVVSRLATGANCEHCHSDELKQEKWAARHTLNKLHLNTPTRHPSHYKSHLLEFEWDSLVRVNGN